MPSWSELTSGVERGGRCHHLAYQAVEQSGSRHAIGQEDQDGGGRGWGGMSGR